MLACETGGRWSEVTANTVQELAAAKARMAPEALKPSAMMGWQRRWSAMLAVAAQASLASTLLGSDPWVAAGRDGFTPGLDIVAEGDVAFSRLPPILEADDDE